MRTFIDFVLNEHIYYNFEKKGGAGAKIDLRYAEPEPHIEKHYNRLKHLEYIHDHPDTDPKDRIQAAKEIERAKHGLNYWHSNHWLHPMTGGSYERNNALEKMKRDIDSHWDKIRDKDRTIENVAKVKTNLQSLYARPDAHTNPKVREVINGHTNYINNELKRIKDYPTAPDYENSNSLYPKDPNSPAMIDYSSPEWKRRQEVYMKQHGAAGALAPDPEKNQMSDYNDKIERNYGPFNQKTPQEPEPVRSTKNPRAEWNPETEIKDKYGKKAFIPNKSGPAAPVSTSEPGPLLNARERRKLARLHLQRPASDFEEPNQS
jgi:hypothetical protein